MIKPEFIAGWIAQNKKKMLKSIAEEFGSELSSDEAGDIMDLVIRGLASRQSNGESVD